MAFDIGSLLTPGKAAVVLSEVQRNIIGDLTYSLLAQVARECGVIEYSARLAHAARVQRAPVIHCLANTSPSRFGASSNARLFKSRCRDPTASLHDPANDAVDSGYQVIIAGDAMSGYPREYHEPVPANTLFMIARLATTDEIVAGGTPARRGELPA